MLTQTKPQEQKKKKKSSRKDKKDIVNLSIDKNSIRLDICSKASREFWGKSQHRIYIGLPDTPENQTKAEEIKSLLKRDILWGEVDKTDERYKFFSQSKAEQLPRVEETFTSLLEMYDEYCEKKRPNLAITTYERNYRKCFLVLFQRIVEIDPKVDIMDSPRMLELSKKVTTSQYYSRVILNKCREIVDSLIVTGKLPIDAVNPYVPRLIREVSAPPSRLKSQEMEDKGYIADSDIRAFSVEELKAILEGFKHIGRPKGRWYPYVAFLALTGCRPGEASGLLWCDIDESLETITFRRSWNSNLEKLKPIKTEKVGGNPVRRVFPCSLGLKELLKSIKPERCNPNDFVFSYRGKPINHQTLNTIWLGNGKREFKGLIERLIEKGNVKQYLKPYALRHSFITHQLAMGQAPADVAYWVGNSPKIIYENYVSRQPTALPGEFLGNFSRTSVEAQPQPEGGLEELVLQFKAEDIELLESIC